MEQSIFEQNGGTYHEENGYLIPDLTLPQRKQLPIGKYGRIHLDYLKKYKRTTYSSLLTQGKLNSYLAGIDQQAKEMLDRIVTKNAEWEGVNDTMKAENPLDWVQKMNTIKLSAEEIIKEQFLLC